MTTITNDLSLNTLIVSSVVALVGWGLKGAAWALTEAIKAAVAHVIRLIAKIETFDSKLGDLTRAVGDVEKMRRDINEYYKQFRLLESRFNESQEKH